MRVFTTFSIILLLPSFILLLLLLVIVRQITCNGQQTPTIMTSYLGSLGEQIYYQGERHEDERQILNRTIKEYNKHFQYVSSEIVYPKLHYWGYNISYIQAIDRIYSQANISIIEGGVNYRHVKIRIVSGLGGRLSFDVRIFTRDPVHQPNTEPPLVIPWLDKMIEEAISKQDAEMAQSTTPARRYF